MSGICKAPGGIFCDPPPNKDKFLQYPPLLVGDEGEVLLFKPLFPKLFAGGVSFLISGKELFQSLMAAATI